MNYSRLGIYVNRKKKGKLSINSKEKNVDWINIFLFLLLFVVIILFFIT